VKRVVADTNILVSAVQFGGKPKQLLDLALDGQVDLAISEDPTDDRILECAVAAEAEVIVSGDTHLLSLGGFRGIPIQRVAEFLHGLQDQGRN
jgi:predicted nucleic acid-binding protein